jgi:nicotinamide riboside kinase
MNISFTGAQSTGKTTLLNKCKEIYSDRFDFIDEVTRLVQREHNVPINELGSNLTQILIINKHVENSLYVTEKQGIIMDRCILDGLCYTAYLHLEGHVSKWVFDYAKRVYKELIGKLDYIFYTDPSDVSLVDDGVRSIDDGFRNKVINAFEFVMLHDSDILEKKIIKLKGTVEERMEQIKMVIC